MRLHNKPWLVLALIAAGTFAALYAINRYQHRIVGSEKDLLGLLPADNATIFYARLDLLRRAGLLKLLAGSHDPEYHAFVLATNFDYSKDLDAIAGSVKPDGIFLAVKGRFDWTSIADYVKQQGGECTNQVCRLPTRSGGKWIGTVRIQPDVLAIAVGQDKRLAAEIHPGHLSMPQPLPSDPVWLSLAPELLKNPVALPLPLRIFAISLQSANSAIIALAPSAGASAAFDIKLTADCPSAVTADTIRKQLEIDTNLLKLELAHEHEKANPADLTGLLTSGTFETSGKQVHGAWRVTPELLRTLQ